MNRPWRLAVLTFLVLILNRTFDPASADVTLVVFDPDGAAAQIGAPAAAAIDLLKAFGGEVDPGRLRLVEGAVPVQFVPDRPGSWSGTLWWLMPPGEPGERRFRLTVGEAPGFPVLAIQESDGGRYYDLNEGPQPVLRYNFGSVPVPEGTPAHFAPDESYERGDYLSPLYGPNGEVLTDDYPVDHPHHRGVWWSWPVTRWRDEVFDIWAVVGVHARPVALRRAEAGPVLAVLEAENVWKWRDRDPIVREEVTLRAFRQVERCRTVDVEVRLTALAEGVAIGGRPHAGYGGFALRAAPCQERQITLHLDPDPTLPRKAWIDYSGLFAGGQEPSGVAIFESVDNPDYPNPQHQYPECNCVMPAFPGDREVPLPPGQTLGLKYRLWIHPSRADEKLLAAVWSAYAHPPTVTVEE